MTLEQRTLRLALDVFADEMVGLGLGLGLGLGQMGDPLAISVRSEPEGA